MSAEVTRSPRESKVFGISARALITLIVVVTVCAMALLGMPVEEPLYTLVGMCVGYYFAQKEKPAGGT